MLDQCWSLRIARTGWEVEIDTVTRDDACFALGLARRAGRICLHFGRGNLAGHDHDYRGSKEDKTQIRL